VHGHLAARPVVTAIKQELDPVLHIVTISKRMSYPTQIPVSRLIVHQNCRPGVNGHPAVLQLMKK